MKPLTYADAGVSIDKEHAAAHMLIKQLAGSGREGIGAPLQNIGHYAGLIDFGDTALALCTDGVGSKTMIADKIFKWDTVGIDCIAMNVNDMICLGAEPLAFVDYLAMDKADSHKAEEIGKGLAEGARQANISILGGETAIMPDLVNGFDISGTALGYVKKEDIITGEAIRPGDVIIGIASDGLHSNGFSLARKIVAESGKSYLDKIDGTDKTMGQRLLTPTKIYVKPILALLAALRPHIRGLAHITGGGITKLTRLNDSVRYVIDAPLTPPPVFIWLQGKGHVEDAEMYRTFNMGMGFCVVVGKEHADEALKLLNTYETAQIIGRIEEGTGVALPTLGIEY